MSFIKILRPINLVLVALTQILIYAFIFVELSSESSTPLLLSPTQFILLILDTMLIAAGGYIINDIIDIDIDHVNKGHKQLIGNKLTKRVAKIYYMCILAIGAAIALYIAFQIDHLALFGIYPIACFLLFGYSFWWKRMPWLGNVVVSLFAAFVPFILLFAERQFYNRLNGVHQEYLLIKIGGFMVFAFLLNLIREIVKDLEDRKGDAQQGYRTAAIVYPINTIKTICYILLVLDFMAICYFTLILPFPDISDWLKYLVISILALLHGFISFKLNYAIAPSQFKKVSTLLKITMLIGLIYFISL